MLLAQGLARLLPVLLALPPLSVAAPAHAREGSVATDTAALAALYDATDGANWTTGTHWKTDASLSSWHGVTTDGAGRVTALDLDDNGLNGTLPAALGDLTALTVLSLEDNALSGALPAELADLTRLATLLLERSWALTGPLPDGLRELAELTTVEIEHTELCAPDDDDFQAWWRTISRTGLICPPAEQSVIDVAIFYTPAIRRDRGGTTAIEDDIDALVVEVNATYRSSGVNQRLRLVAVQETAYTESESHRTDLDRLRNPADGHMDEVHPIRRHVAADIVALVRLGVPTSSARTATHASLTGGFTTVYGTGSRTFAHELGHLMGLQHDRYMACWNGFCRRAAFPYAYGHVVCGGPSSAYRRRTIMGYPDRCGALNWVLRFSNPEQTYSLRPLGVAGLAPSGSIDGPSDAVRALNRARGYVANSMRAPDITVSFRAAQYTATEGGAAAAVTVQLSAAPTRSIEIPLTAAAAGATGDDYADVPASVSFGADDTEQTVTVTAVDDAVDDDGESVTLTFGVSLPAGVTVGGRAETAVNLADNDTVTPVLQAAEVELTALTLRYDRMLDETSVPATSAFTVRVDGVARSVTAVVVRGSTVALTLGLAVPYGEDGATVSYTPGLRPLRDRLGNPAAAFSDQPVTSEVPPYDTDADGLIEITTVAQLDALRYDPDGDGDPAATGATAYQAAFPDGDTPLRCAGGCAGYELFADLDLSGRNWEPIGANRIGSAYASFAATFEGNGHTIANLYIEWTTVGSRTDGLFRAATSSAVIRNVGLVNVSVTTSISPFSVAGGLVGSNSGTVRSVHVTGRVRGGQTGGLAGANFGTIASSYAAVRVSGRGTSAGGLVGDNRGTITAGYATGSVSGISATDVGGLVGNNAGTISASYATGPVWPRAGSAGQDREDTGGLVGANSGTVTSSSWDTVTSGDTTSAGGAGRPTTAMQASTGSTSTWDHGTAGQYSALRANFDGRGAATWQEFGYQLRAGPTLTATAGGGAAALSWTAVGTSAWSPAPDATYTVTRDDGTTVTVIDEALSGLTAADTAVPAGSTWTYQVAAVVAGGEAVRSAPVPVTGVAPNQPPSAVGTLPALTLPIGAAAVSVAVSGAFSDPEDDALVYGAVSSAPAVAAVSVSGARVRVTPQTACSATVTVTATDVDGSNTAAAQTFEVTVTGGPDSPEPPPGPGGPPGGGGRNRAPQAVGTLADRTLEVGESPLVAVSGAFRDRDGDVLTYAAESSAAAVAAVVDVSGGVVTVAALAAGAAAVTVTATDAEGSNRSAEQTFAVTVTDDADGDGLIGVHTLSQLDAVRHDLDGDGAPAAAGASGYAAAFGVTGAGTVPCAAAGGCRGYELGSDLDFDTNGSGGPDAGDAWWDGGAGWLPLGTAAEPFTAVFEGNGRVVRGLFVRRDDVAGLFGATGSSGVVRGVGVTAVDVTGGTAVGGLVGVNGGLVTGSHATGRVAGEEAVGGLVGRNAGDGVVVGSYAAVQVSGATSAGGLVGANAGRVAAVQATGRVSGTRRVGGLVGYNRGALEAGYATGRVRGEAETGGLVGVTEAPGTVTDSFWDTDTSGLAAGAPGDRAATAGRGQTTSALQAPTDYAGLYAAWNVDVDGDDAADDPWDFGTAAQYPALSLDVDGDGRAGWREVGRQLRAGPALTAAAAVDPARVDLTWTAAGAGARAPAPDVTYTVTREAAGAVATVATGLRGLRYADRGVEPGAAYRYQVAAVVAGGEAARSALAAVQVPCAYAVAPLHRDVLWRADTGEVSVTTGPGCEWTAASAASAFLTVTAGASGTGSGTVTWAVEANAGVPRTGVLLVAGRRVTVYQASPTAWTDDPIRPGVTPVRAIHFLELRARIDALRAAAGLLAYGWTDPELIPGVTPVERVHLTELRAVLAEAYVAAGHAASAWTGAAVTAGTSVIEAAHLEALRAAVGALEARR